MSRTQFAKDEFDKEILLKDGSIPVVMEWEKPYLEKIIEALNPKDADVLEVGYGLGYSAERVQQYHPKSHTIIESDRAVAHHAKEWAKQKKNVTIMEGKWQDLLSKLGTFDVIFFNDYMPVEKEQIQQMILENERCKDAVEEAQSLREALADNLKQWQGLKFSDDDIRAFGKQVLSKPGVTVRDVLDFVEYLEDMEHITQQQKNVFLKEFQDEASKKYMPKGSSVKPSAFGKVFLGDQFLSFLETSFDWHLRAGGRLSAYVGNPESKKDSQEFKDRILSKKGVKYTEKTIPVDVPENCKYYEFDKALIMVIEKK